MCECNCGPLEMAYMKISEDCFLTVGLHPGCGNCCVDGPHLVLAKVNAKDFDDWFDSHVAVDMNTINVGDDETLLPIVQEKDICQTITEEQIEDFGDYDSFSDFWGDHHDLLRLAVMETQARLRGK